MADEKEKKSVREQLSRIFRSGPFVHSPRRQRFLQYIVNETLAGRPERLKGYSIGIEVFGRPEAFDPVADPIVRIEAARLREKLRDYYSAIGKQDPIRIDLPKGAYTPQIKFRRERAKGGRTTREKPPATVPAIAILSFEDLSAERGLGYLGDGVSEDIITSLSRFPDLAVVARSSSFAYNGKTVDIRKIGKELGVDYVVEGSIRKGDDKVRIVAQLIDTKNGAHVWAERFDRSGADPWALQDDVIGMIVSAIAGEQGALRHAEYRQAWGKGTTTTLEEYDYYLRGHEQLMKYTREGVEASGKIWREGLAKFPSSLLLNIKLGWQHMVRAYMFISADPPADFRKAGELARRVLDNEHLSPQVARLANWLVSYVLLQERDFDGALAAAEKALALAPYDTFMRSRLTMVLLQAGETKTARNWIDQIAKQDPALAWSYNYARGWIDLILDRLAEARDAFKQTEFNDAHLLLAITYARLGRPNDARSQIEKAMKINPTITSQIWRLGYSYRDAALLEHCAADLVRLGLPES